MIKINEKGKHDLYCLHCGVLIDDYHADLKCPECRCDLEGEVRQAMIEFKQDLDKNNLVCIGDKIFDRNEDSDKIFDATQNIKLELEIKEFIGQYNLRSEYSGFVEEMATMNVRNEMDKIVVRKNRFKK
jgi:hypothetical protein